MPAPRPFPMGSHLKRRAGSPRPLRPMALIGVPLSLFVDVSGWHLPDCDHRPNTGTMWSGHAFCFVANQETKRVRLA